MMRLMSQMPLITLSLTGLCLAITALFGFAPHSLVFLEQNIFDGELWRLVTAHFSHSDSAHLLWNTVALVMIGSLLEIRIGKSILGVYAIGIVSVNIYLFLETRLSAYCGLSGVLNTVLLALLSTLMLDRKTRWIAILTAIAALAKILVEINLGEALFTHTAWASVPVAHLVGFSGGFVWITLNASQSAFWKSLNNRKQKYIL